MTREKSAIRKIALSTRAEAHDRGHDLTDPLLAEVARHQPKVIAGYWPMRSEADPRHALHDLATHYTICLPVVTAKDAPLAFRVWDAGLELVPGSFGTMVPPADAGERIPDLLIVPLVAFDRRGFRLGYGGGFYDRTLEALRQTGPVTAIGLAYAAQEVPRVPTDAKDQPLDAVVTESGTHRR